jgi:tRNA(adenine34) deaminase
MTTALRLRGTFAFLLLLLISDDVHCWNTRLIRGLLLQVGSSRRQSRQRTLQHFPLGTDDMIIHEHFFDLAIHEAKLAAKRGEVPIGAVVVRNITKDDAVMNSNQQSSSFEVLSSESNRVEQNYDAAAHAELLALRSAAQNIRNWRLQNCTLYSTLECCPMCLSACQAFRIERLVYGAPDLRLGAVETHLRLLDDYIHPFHNLSVVIPRVKEDQCSTMMKDFFRQRRKQTTYQKAIRLRPQWQRRWMSFWRSITYKLRQFPFLAYLRRRGSRNNGGRQKFLPSL